LLPPLKPISGKNQCGVGYLSFKIIVGFRYLKIKNSKNHSGLVFLFLEDLKNHLSSDLKTPKRDGYEVGPGVKVCDLLGIKLNSLSETRKGRKRFFY
jgi:hypothetical protein